MKEIMNLEDEILGQNKVKQNKIINLSSLMRTGSREVDHFACVPVVDWLLCHLIVPLFVYGSGL